MRWELINKGSQPLHGSKYNDWKEDLAMEGNNRCVYCAIKEGPFGGIRNFHVEHYKPKSIPKFGHLIHHFPNLFFACSICNCFKGADWPNDPNTDLTLCCYPDPSLHNYDSIFLINSDTGKVIGTNNAAKYMVSKLYLNRPQLLLERKHYFLAKKLSQLVDQTRERTDRLRAISIAGNDQAIDYLYSIVQQVLTLIELREKLTEIRPYSIEQVQRPR